MIRLGDQVVNQRQIKTRDRRLRRRIETEDHDDQDEVSRRLERLERSLGHFDVKYSTSLSISISCLSQGNHHSLGFLQVFFFGRFL